MSASTLIVAIRGWSTTGDLLLFGQPGGEVRPSFVAALERCLTDTEVWAPEVDLGMFSMRSAESVCQELLAAIDRKVREAPGQRIILLGYSAGSVLARRVFCLAHGAEESGTLGGEALPWAGRIERLVVLAGITRGWEFSSASPAYIRYLSPLINLMTRSICRLKRLFARQESPLPFVWQLKRGAPFVVATRIQYVCVIEALRRAGAQWSAGDLRSHGLPSTVFLLGAQDEYISPADCTELGPRAEFAFIELPGSNHTQAMQIEGDTPTARIRRERLSSACRDAFAKLAEHAWSLPASDIDDYLDPMDLVAARTADGGNVDQVAIIVHGIRDNGFWTKRVAREIKTLGRQDGREVRTPTPSYGYFSMWDFVRPGGREKAAYWFLERYADVRSHFPNAAISFVGHSNGTYIAARALELCPAIRFDKVVFAGSVVRRSFPWHRYADRVNAVLNYVGSSDGVVAFLPAVFEFFRWHALDVGGAGAYGFDEAREQANTARPRVTELRFVEGGHGAAVSEPYWPQIAGFVVRGVTPQHEEVRRSPLTTQLFRMAPAITLAGIACVGAVLASPVIVALWNSLVAPQLGSPEDALSPTMLSVAFLLSIFLSWAIGRFLKTW
nr:hypothetical protein [Dechloromonas sp.]